VRLGRRIKADTAGKMMRDEKMQAEGKMDKAKGAAHNAAETQRTPHATPLNSGLEKTQIGRPVRTAC
jgi:hypothetical protein